MDIFVNFAVSHINLTNMKRNLITLFIAGLLSLPASASDYNYLTLTLQNGQEQSLVASGLTITFSGGNLVATVGGTTTTIALSSLEKMAFTTEATSISTVETAKDGAPLHAYSLQGIDLGTFDSVDQLRSQCGKGVYVVKQNDRTSKIAVE
jgi:hypothetical protein